MIFFNRLADEPTVTTESLWLMIAPLRKNTVSTLLHFRFYANYFLLPWKFLKKLTDNQCSSITKDSIYHIMKHMYIQPFTIVVDWPDIGCLMEVSTMSYNCRYCVFTWWGRWVMLQKEMSSIGILRNYHTFKRLLKMLHALYYTDVWHKL